MVKIVDYKKRTNSTNGNEFFALILQSGLELVKSKTTGNFYATSKRASISSTFDETTCQSLIGQEIPGSIQRIECDPFEVTIRETGDVITLSHRWIYLREGESLQEKIVAPEKVAIPLL